jgi:hypothetical protein
VLKHVSSFSTCVKIYVHSMNSEVICAKLCRVSCHELNVGRPRVSQVTISSKSVTDLRVLSSAYDFLAIFSNFLQMTATIHV